MQGTSVAAGVTDPERVTELVAEDLGRERRIAVERALDAVLDHDAGLEDAQPAHAAEPSGRPVEENASDRQRAALVAVEASFDLVVGVAEHDAVAAVGLGEVVGAAVAEEDVADVRAGIVVPGGHRLQNASRSRAGSLDPAPLKFQPTSSAGVELEPAEVAAAVVEQA